MNQLHFVLWGLLLATFPASTWAEVSKAQTPLVILAASSLTHVLPQVAQAWQAKGGQTIQMSFESTSRLAQQIKGGAPADLFFSADSAWMDELEKTGKIEATSRISLLSNRITLVVPSDSTFVPSSSSSLTNSQVKYLALANESVPAGKFARAALIKEKIFEGVKHKIVNAENVRAALHWVAKKEAEAGIVFRTDAFIEPKVKIAFTFSEASHPKINYAAAIISNSRHNSKDFTSSQKFLSFCKSNEAKQIFEAAGFIVLN